jgi:hypothetical protein
VLLFIYGNPRDGSVLTVRPTGNFFDYDPSFPAAIIFAVLYTIPCLVTVYQYVALRCWFWIFMVIASISEFWTFVRWIGEA